MSLDKFFGKGGSDKAQAPADLGDRRTAGRADR